MPWSPADLQLRARIELLRKLEPDAGWPHVNEAALLDTLDLWLLPFLDQVHSRSELEKVNFGALVRNLVPPRIWSTLDDAAPTHFTAPRVVPGGRTPRYAIDYLPVFDDRPPVLPVRLQAVLGMDVTPSVASGRQPLLIELLSPANRPIQLTSDLPGFWRGSYQAVRRELRGRYPKHDWPADALQF